MDPKDGLIWGEQKSSQSEASKFRSSKLDSNQPVSSTQTKKKYNDNDTNNLILTIYAYLQRCLKQDEQLGEFSDQIYSKASRILTKKMDMPDKETYKRLWDDYRSGPERFPIVQERLKHMKPKLEEKSECLNAEDRKELSECAQKMLGIDHKSICFTGYFIVRVGAPIKKQNCGRYTQKGGREGLLIYMAMHIEAGQLGPYFFDVVEGQDEISAEEYRTLLATKLIPDLKAKLCPESFEKVIFQQKGFDYQEDPITMSYLRSVFGQRLISRSTPIRWPKFDDDINPIHFGLQKIMMRCCEKTIAKQQSIKSIKSILMGLYWA